MSDVKPTPEKEIPSLGDMLKIVALILPILATQGFVAADMWNWFVTPLGFADVTVPQMAGIVLMVKVVTVRLTKKDDPVLSLEDAIKRTVSAIFAYGFLWVIAKGITLL